MIRRLLCAAAVPALLLSVEEVRFHSAKPVWPQSRETEMNLFVGFRAVFDTPDGEPPVLRLTGSTVYRIFLNGSFLGYGPARGPHGHYRVDECTLKPLLAGGRNVVAIEVAGYNVNSYYLLDQPSFLEAEVVAGGRVLASTAGAGVPFEAAILPQRVQKVQRYSFQRPFVEVYRLAPDSDRWRTDPSWPLETAKLAAVDPKRFLPRRIPYPDFRLRQPLHHTAQGTVQTGVTPTRLWRDRALTNIGPILKGYREEELEIVPSLDLQRLAFTFRGTGPASYAWGDKILLAEDSYHVLDFSTNLTGFLGARIACKRPARVYFTFDETLSDGDVDFKRLGCVNAVTFDLAPGTYDVESFEPYTLRFLKLIAARGEAGVERVHLREYVNPDVWSAHFASSDERLNRLFAAGRETFRQNALDVFMDCPSRERAGWLCDSFFTSRVAHVLSGNTAIEKNFFENFLLPGRFEHMPEGMLPMCYPADHPDGVFIPNWSLWFVLQLEEYLQRSGDRQLVDALRPRVMKLFDYFRPFRNQDGLLEGLKSWVFIEWSDANKFVQDVNYPSNMLYAAALSAAGRMYAVPELAREAERIRETIRRQSFDGRFFVDNAVRRNGVLSVTRNRTEVCQYFAFYFGVATPRTHAGLWSALSKEFGPDRARRGLHPDIHKANSFVGNVLRLELLSRYGLSRQMLDESAAYLLYMADRTGTLWENVDPSASLNHGFASHAVNALYRDVLGIEQIDSARKKVRVRLNDLDLAWCEGRVPTLDGSVFLRWTRDGEKVTYQLDTPAGYEREVINDP